MPDSVLASGDPAGPGDEACRDRKAPCLGASKLGRRSCALLGRRVASWFANYRRAMVDIARIAAAERADAVAIGTELEQTTNRAEWFGVIAAVRKVYGGHLTYFAHNIEEAEAVPFWRELDTVGVTLYPALGADRDRAGRLAVMRDAAERLDALAARTGRSVLVGESGFDRPKEPPRSRGRAPKSAQVRPIRCCRHTCWPTGLRCSTALRSTAC